MHKKGSVVGKNPKKSRYMKPVKKSKNSSKSNSMGSTYS